MIKVVYTENAPIQVNVVIAVLNYPEQLIELCSG